MKSLNLKTIFTLIIIISIAPRINSQSLNKKENLLQDSIGVTDTTLNNSDTIMDCWQISIDLNLLEQKIENLQKINSISYLKMEIIKISNQLHQIKSNLYEHAGKCQYIFSISEYHHSSYEEKKIFEAEESANDTISYKDK